MGCCDINLQQQSSLTTWERLWLAGDGIVMEMVVAEAERMWRHMRNEVTVTSDTDTV